MNKEIEALMFSNYALKVKLDGLGHVKAGLQLQIQIAHVNRRDIYHLCYFFQALVRIFGEQGPC